MTRNVDGRAAQIESVSALADPVRRSLYDLVVASDLGEVSRDQAAEALGIRRGLAAFHLDKLVGAGLLRAGYRRPAGAGGPGAGRPAKYYRRSENEVGVSLPARRYDLMGTFLAGAISGAGSGGLRAARAAARDYGRRIGTAAREEGRAPGARAASRAVALLSEHGFEPVRVGRDRIVLRNCPFHALATRYTETVCDVNYALHCGLIEGLGTETLKADREQAPDRCCVSYRVG